MRLTDIIAAVAALSMASAPAVAAPSNPAAKLSLANKDVRAGAPVKRTNKASSSSAIFIAGGALIAIVLLAVALGNGDGDSSSASS